MTPSLNATTTRPLRRLWVFAVISWFAYLLVTVSSQSLHESGSGQHSLLYLLGLFGVAMMCYWMAIRETSRLPSDRRTLIAVIVPAILFRVTLLFSDPIEEIDIYRYLWDGEAVISGVNPFRYSPHQVLGTSLESGLPDDLARLVARRDRSVEMRMILERVHFGQLPTIYPPVSQCIFALATSTTPSGSSVVARMIVLKSWFVVFDLGTIWLVAELLRRTSHPLKWIILYAWCPLLMKEIANSGHLDALAVFLTTAASLCAVGIGESHSRSRSDRFWSAASGIFLALAVGAKLYPMILAPWLFSRFVRRRGWRFALLPCLLFSVLSLLVTWPMWPDRTPSLAATESHTAYPAIQSEGEPPLPPAEVTTEPRDPSESLRAFLSKWEMNDFFFLVVIENLRPNSEVPQNEVAWFSVVPERFRERIVDMASELLPVDRSQLPFMLTRALLTVLFTGLAIRWAWAAAGQTRDDLWLEAGFLTLVWFWLLLPTVNPWYLTWCLPFLTFTRNRAWLMLPGLAFFYYVRFWLVAQFPDFVPGTHYTGAIFFDYVMTWIEFAPWLICLSLEAQEDDGRSGKIERKGSRSG